MKQLFTSIIFKELVYLNDSLLVRKNALKGISIKDAHEELRNTPTNIL